MGSVQLSHGTLETPVPIGRFSLTKKPTIGLHQCGFVATAINKYT